MTIKKSSRKLLPILFHEPVKNHADLTKDYFSPLLAGKPIVLLVNDPRAPKKTRLVDAPLLFITPMSVYGGVEGNLLISFQSYGSEVIEGRNPRLIEFMRVGLNATLSKAIVSVIKQVFIGESHGSCTPCKKSAD